MKINWTPRARKRFTDTSNYIASEFYADYADAWEEDVAATVEHLAKHPQLGHEAFPNLNRPEIRRILLATKTIGSTIASQKQQSTFFPSNTDSSTFVTFATFEQLKVKLHNLHVSYDALQLTNGIFNTSHVASYNI